MKRIKFAFLSSILVLTACDHHKPAPSAEASSSPMPVDSASTGEHIYPRALPVALPAALPVASAPSSSSLPETAAAATPPTEEPPPTAPSLASASTPVPPPPAPPGEPTSATGTSGTDLKVDASAPALQIPSPAIAPLPPPPLSDAEARKQVVVLQTNFGKIVIELDDVAAPRTCGNFRKLVLDGFYDHTIFHRVIPHFMIQGGDPNSKTTERVSYGQGDPGYALPAEIQLKHTAGAVAMARLPDGLNPKRDSNGSQFYICVADCPSLDDQYTVFGHVILGLDVANQIANQSRDVHDDPIDRIEMKAHLETKGQALGNAGASP